MKKTVLLLSLFLIGWCARAQVILTGTAYTQNFDGIGNALPPGWSVDSVATSVTKGFPMAFDTTRASWSAAAGKARNYAAKSTHPWNETTTSQAAATNRALGLRQVGATDSQMAFTLQIANTLGLSNFSLAFSIMSLDSNSSRLTNWKVEYGIGSFPFVFQAATTTGVLTTGGNTFSESPITATFGTSLDNMPGPVWIRIVSPSRTTGPGNRASTGIDDLVLSYSGTPPPPNYSPVITPVSPIDNATGVSAGVSVLKMAFNRKVVKGTSGNITIKNETDGTSQPIAVTSSDVTLSAAGDTAFVANVNLATGKSYHVLVDSIAFDTAGYRSIGIVDTTRWNFSTQGSVFTLTSLSESFEANCPAQLPAGWSQYSKQGQDQFWRCNATAANYGMVMNGNNATGSVLNEDWLITPRINPASLTNIKLAFKAKYRFVGPDMEVKFSIQYTGTGDPNQSVWSNLAGINFTSADSNVWNTKTAAIPAVIPFFIAFKYTSTQSTPGNGREWSVDSVFLNGIPTGIATINSRNSSMPVYVLGAATNDHVVLGFDLEKESALQVAIYDIAGRQVYKDSFKGAKGNNKIALDPQSLQSGMYIIRLGNGTQQGIARTFIQ